MLIKMLMSDALTKIVDVKNEDFYCVMKTNWSWVRLKKLAVEQTIG